MRFISSILIVGFKDFMDREDMALDALIVLALRSPELSAEVTDEEVQEVLAEGMDEENDVGIFCTRCGQSLGTNPPHKTICETCIGELQRRGQK
jgi:hypothetical protein